VPKGDAQDRGSLVENEAEGLMRKGSLRCYTFNGETGRKAARYGLQLEFETGVIWTEEQSVTRQGQKRRERF